MKITLPHPHDRRLWAAIFLMMAIAYVAFLGVRPLATPSEGRYAEIPREMVASGEWMTPRLNGLIYIEKPPLYYWAAAGSISIFGNSVAALRLVPALFALWACFICYRVTNNIYDRKTARMAALILGSSALFFTMSRSLLTDMVFSSCVTTAILLFLQMRTIKNKRHFLYLYAAISAFIAAAVLSKGLIGIVIPGFVIGAWCIISREWHLVFNRYLPIGIAVLLAIAAPWHIWMANHYPQFLDFYFVREHFTRYLTDEHHRYQPFWFFVPVAFFGMMPWFGFLPQTIRHAYGNWNWKKPSADMFMVLWIILPLLFFSASHSKLVPYIIPIIPPMAILIARYWSSAVGDKYTGILACAAIMTFLAITAFAASAFPAIGGKNYAELLTAASPALFTLAAIAGIGAIMAFLWRRHSDWAMIAIAIGAIGTFLAADNAAGQLDRKSIKPLAEAILPQLQGGGKKVASYYFYPQDLPYYIGQTIIIVGWIGELEFATTAQDTSHTLIDDAQFWQDWKNRRIDFVFMPKSAYDQLDDAKKQLLLPWVFDSNVIVAQNRTK